MGHGFGQGNRNPALRPLLYWFPPGNLATTSFVSKVMQKSDPSLVLTTLPVGLHTIAGSLLGSVGRGLEEWNFTTANATKNDKAAPAAI